jgi:hypothetical protein
MAIGTAAGYTIGAVATAVGASAATSAAIASVVAAMVNGAIVGAVVGGFSAAIMGGDIGQGVLYGAVGGAVSAGIGSYFSGATSGAASAGSGAAGSSVNAGTQLALIEGSYGPSAGSSGAAGGGESSFFSSGGESSGLGTSMIEGAFQIGGAVLKGKAAEDAAREAAKNDAIESQKDRDAAMARLKEQLESQKELQPTDHFGEELAFRREELYANLKERKREFDIPLEEAETKRKRSGGVLANLAAIRRGTFSRQEPSIQEQIFQNSPGYMPDTPTLNTEGDVENA